MPPKYKYTKEEIVSAALALIRDGGADALTARGLGERLNSSSKVVFGAFSSMEELRCDVMTAANTLYLSYIASDMAKGEYPPYKASGMAYIRFAREEKELFKLLFMRDRSCESINDDEPYLEELYSILMSKFGITREQAQLFHVEMWVYAHGIATMIATDYLPWDIELISQMMTDVYNGIKIKYENR